MDPDDEDRWSRQDDRDVVRLGSPRQRHRWPRWLPIAFVAALIVALVVAWVVPKGTPPASSPPATPTPVQSSTAGQSAKLPKSARPKVRELHHRLLGVTAKWELFAFARTTVVRIQLARGRITYTNVPALRSDGPVSFVVGPHQAIVRPLDFVPGYAVPDGRRTRKLTGPLGYGGPVIPGPAPNQVWVASRQHEHRMVLVRFDGRRTGTSVRASTGDESTAGVLSDGGGHLMVTGTGGAYQARPDGWHRITTGSVVAVGPTGWLAVECGDQHHCANVVIDRASGARHVLPGRAANTDTSTGVISPDGSTAAVYRRTSGGKTTLHLLNLSTGANHRILTVDHTSFGNGSVAWSPDSRWLFVADGTLLAVDVHTRHVRQLGVALPGVNQLAVRRTHH